jgi:HTH-type transcriptional regulator/antitoxin HigA
MKKIENEDDYARASQRADELCGAGENSPQKQELDELLAAIKEYEYEFVRMLRENG